MLLEKWYQQNYWIQGCIKPSICKKHYTMRYACIWHYPKWLNNQETYTIIPLTNFLKSLKYKYILFSPSCIFKWKKILNLFLYSHICLILLHFHVPWKIIFLNMPKNFVNGIIYLHSFCFYHSIFLSIIYMNVD